MGVLTGEVGIVDLCVAEAGIVEDLELDLVGLGDVGEVIVVVDVGVVDVGFLGTVAEVVPMDAIRQAIRRRDERKRRCGGESHTRTDWPR